MQYWREALIVILAIVCFSSIKSCSDKKSDIALLKNAKDSAYNVAIEYKNKLGQSVFQVKTHEVTISQLKENNEALGIDNKALKKQVGSLNNLVGYWKGKAYLNDTITIINRDTVYIDSTGTQVTGKWFAWSNNYLSLDGITTQKTTTIAYNYQVDFTLVTYRKYQGIFKKRQLVSDVYFSDPSIKVREFKGVVIKEPSKKWWETRAASFGAGFIFKSLLDGVLNGVP